MKIQQALNALNFFRTVEHLYLFPMSMDLCEIWLWNNLIVGTVSVKLYNPSWIIHEIKLAHRATSTYVHKHRHDFIMQRFRRANLQTVAKMLLIYDAIRVLPRYKFHGNRSVIQRNVIHQRWKRSYEKLPRDHNSIKICRIETAAHCGIVLFLRNIFTNDASCRFDSFSKFLNSSPHCW